MTVCDRALFSLNKEFFRYFEKKKKSFFFFCFFFFCFVFFWKFPFFLESFGLALLVPFDTFVAEHVANLLS